MTVVEARRWRDLFAARAREDVGAGIVETGPEPMVVVVMFA